MTAKISWSVNNGPVSSETRDLGNLPMMVRVRPPPNIKLLSLVL